jgi:protein-tyrosine phosphatase
MNYHTIFLESYQEIQSNDSFTMITPNVAIGNINSSYDPFDIIVNLAFPSNDVELHKIKITDVTDKNKQIIRVGIYDSPDEPMDMVLNTLIPKLLTEYNKKILFHCHAGISRSSTLAIAYLSKLNHTSLQDTLHQVKSKRPIVNPNPGFMKSLQSFLN